MSKLTKRQLQKHEHALELLTYDKLNDADKWDVLSCWQPDASSVTKNKAFFTSHENAESLAQDAQDVGRVLDLCAGIGMLSYHVWRTCYRREHLELVCVEKDPVMVEVGKKIVPSAKWICADIFNVGTWSQLGQFTQVISNPPYGVKVGKKGWWLDYKGPSELMAVEVALRLSPYNTFILPQGHCLMKTNSRQKIEPNDKITETSDKFREMWPQVYWQSSAFPMSGFQDTKTQTELVGLDWDREYEKITTPEQQMRMV